LRFFFLGLVGVWCVCLCFFFLPNLYFLLSWLCLFGGRPIGSLPHQFGKHDKKVEGMLATGEACPSAAFPIANTAYRSVGQLIGLARFSRKACENKLWSNL